MDKFTEAVLRGLQPGEKGSVAQGPPKSAMPKPGPDIAAWKEDMKKTFGIAGETGIELFKKGKGVNFRISENGEPMAEMRGEGDDGLYIDGEKIGNYQTLRKALLNNN